MSIPSLKVSTLHKHVSVNVNSLDVDTRGKERYNLHLHPHAISSYRSPKLRVPVLRAFHQYLAHIAHRKRSPNVLGHKGHHPSGQAHSSPRMDDLYQVNRYSKLMRISIYSRRLYSSASPFRTHVSEVVYYSNYYLEFLSLWYRIRL